MPTSTFFRLPEEKRQRLLDAAWAEFIRVRYVDVSINRIIQDAQIPRGSFYQYFADKEDLFYYLLGDMRSYFIHVLEEILSGNRGDLFAMPLAAFDRFVQRGGSPEANFGRYIQMMRRNQGMDIRLVEKGQLLPEYLACLVDVRCLRSKERCFLEDVFFLLIAPLVCAVTATLQRPEQWAEQRDILQRRVEIIRRGSLAESRLSQRDNKEE